MVANKIPIAEFKLFSTERPKDGQAVIYTSKSKRQIGIGYYFESFNMVIANDKVRFNIVDGDKWVAYSYSGNLDISV